MDSEKVFITLSSTTEPTTSLERVFATTINAVETEDAPTNMCRLCAAETEFVVPIFEGDGLQNGLADKIHKHLPIQVSPTDALPLVVCYQCASTLLAWHELVQCCVQADHAMRTRFSIATSPTQIDQPTNQVSHNQSQEIIKNITSVLMNYFYSLNMEEYSSQVKLVCHRCLSRPPFTSEDFTQHLLSQHKDVTTKRDINTFVRNHVTFEEVLQSDSEAHHSDAEQSEPEVCQEKPLPTLLCPHCDCAFSSTGRLVSHLNTHREISMELGVECCRVTYTNRRQYVSHLQEAHVSRLVYDVDTLCRACGHHAASRDLLRAHVAHIHPQPQRGRTKHSDKNQKCIPAVCPECNKTFSNKYNMLFHMKSHSSRASHVCDTCGKRYTTRGNLAQHRRAAHEGRMPHLCALCGERFHNRAARDAHAGLHHAARHHVCRLCRKGFRDRGTLRSHMKMHYDVRDHACPLCGKAFRKRSHLNAHARTHRTSNEDALLQSARR